MKTFKLLLLFLLGVPILDSKYPLYIFLLLLCISGFKNISFRKTINFLLLLLPIIFCELLIYNEFFTVSISIFFSFIIANSFEKIKLNSLKYVLFLFIGFHIISFISLNYFGFDLIPLYIYGESRHLVGVNSLIQFRPSGLFLEPSTLSINYIALTIMFIYNKEKTRFKKLFLFLSVIFSILTFSVISIISLIIILVHLRKIFNSFLYKVLLISSSLFFISSFFTKFIIPKISLYIDSGLENYSRFELIYVALKNFGITPIKLVQEGVALDNGPIIYLLLLSGIYSLPLILFLLKNSLKDSKLLLLIFTKISVTYPLIWLILKEKNEN